MGVGHRLAVEQRAGDARDAADVGLEQVRGVAEERIGRGIGQHLSGGVDEIEQRRVVGVKGVVRQLHRRRAERGIGRVRPGRLRRSVARPEEHARAGERVHHRLVVGLRVRVEEAGHVAEERGRVGVAGVEIIVQRRRLVGADGASGAVTRREGDAAEDEERIGRGGAVAGHELSAGVDIGEAVAVLVDEGGGERAAARRHAGVAARIALHDVPRRRRAGCAGGERGVLQEHQRREELEIATRPRRHRPPGEIRLHRQRPHRRIGRGRPQLLVRRRQEARPLRVRRAGYQDAVAVRVELRRRVVRIRVGREDADGAVRQIAERRIGDGRTHRPERNVLRSVPAPRVEVRERRLPLGRRAEGAQQPTERLGRLRQGPVVVQFRHPPEEIGQLARQLGLRERRIRGRAAALLRIGVRQIERRHQRRREGRIERADEVRAMGGERVHPRNRRRARRLLRRQRHQLPRAIGRRRAGRRQLRHVHGRRVGAIARRMTHAVERDAREVLGKRVRPDAVAEHAVGLDAETAARDCRPRGVDIRRTGRQTRERDQRSERTCPAPRVGSSSRRQATFHRQERSSIGRRKCPCMLGLC